MNYLELSSFIEAKKKSKAHFEQELRYVSTLTANLKAQKPVKWYHNAYYIAKRTLFLLLAIVSIFFVISSFTNQRLYKNYFEKNFETIISAALNETFGTHQTRTYSETSAVDSMKIEQIISKPVRYDIQNRISTKAYEYSLNTGRILFLFAALLFWYVARLTRKLHLKNKLIIDYYDSNLLVMEVYKEVIKEQNFEIEFLTKAGKL